MFLHVLTVISTNVFKEEPGMSYIDLMKEKARSDKKTIVLPETNDKRTLIAAANILKEEIADIIMIGNEEKIMDGAGWLEVELDGVTIIDPEKTEKLEEYVTILYETRKNKGMTPEKAKEILLNDYLTFGVVMVKANDADGMVAGACHAMRQHCDDRFSTHQTFETFRGRVRDRSQFFRGRVLIQPTIREQESPLLSECAVGHIQNEEAGYQLDSGRSL